MIPFQDALPEGMTWAEVTDGDRDWLKRTGRSQEGVGCVRIAIKLRRTSDGAERVYVDDWYPFDAVNTTREQLIDGIQYQWTQGNHSCDCNRRDSFASAGGEESPGDFDCSDGEFSIVAPAWLAEEQDQDHADN